MDTSSVPAQPVANTPSRSSRSWWWSGALVAGDALSFLAFAAAGRQQHSVSAGPGVLATLGATALTALPFALGWFLVAPWLGAFRRSLFERPWRMLRRTELAWLCAWPATVILRALLVQENLSLGSRATFAVVILIANALFLGVWRMLFAVFARFVGRLAR